VTAANGLFLVDKPPGPSSFGVLRSLRPALGRKLGHAGTLDPFAGGLLLVLAGRATRLATFLSGLDKTYRAVVQFGATSITLPTSSFGFAALIARNARPCARFTV